MQNRQFCQLPFLPAKTIILAIDSNGAVGHLLTRSAVFVKVYLKTKKMTNISQAQAGFKANSRRNPLWISRLIHAKSGCACRNRLNFRLFRCTLGDAAPFMVRTPHKGETAQNGAMQILLSIIIHKSFPKAINGRFCLQKRNKFHKQAFPHKVISRNPAGMQTVKNKAGRGKTDILIKV